MAFSSLADRIGTTNQTLNLHTAVAYRLRLTRLWNTYYGFTLGIENQKRFWPDYRDRYNLLQPSLEFWNVEDPFTEQKSNFWVFHSHFALTGPKIFFGIQYKNINYPLDATNNKVYNRF